MGGRLRGLRALSWIERRELALMAVTLPLIDVALRLFGYSRTRRWLERRSLRTDSRTATAGDLDAAQTAARLAAVAGRHGVVTTTCLRQSLLLYWLLRRRGLRPDLRIGVHKEAGEFGAHAWVELDGHRLEQTPNPHLPFALPDRTA